MKVDSAYLPVAVVIPVLNEKQCLPEILDALLSLHPKPQEVVIVDAGSTDGSLDLITSWIARAAVVGLRVNLIESYGALPGAARNVGISNAHEHWIAFLDAGVNPSPEWLKELWNCQQTTQAEAVYGTCRFECKTSLGEMICAASYGVGRTRPTLPGSLFSRKLLHAVGGFNDHLRAGEDKLFKQALNDASVSAPICDKSEVIYAHFPSSLTAAIQKVFAYHKSIAANPNVYQRRENIFIMASMLAGLLAIINLSLGGLLVAGYVCARGVIDPMRRSQRIIWWSSPWRPLVFPGVVALLDIASLLGSMYGRLKYLLRKQYANTAKQP